MRPHRKVVKDWLRTVDREELNAVIETAIFTPDELKYIHMRLIEGKAFKQIAILCDLSRRNMATIADKISGKMYRAITKLHRDK